MKKSVEIIIPTYLRDVYVVNLLKNLGLQTYKEFKVSVGYQGDISDFDKFREKVQKMKLPYKLSIVHFVTPSITITKNELIRKSEAEYILTLDDDIIPQENLLEKHLSSIKDLSGGLVLEDNQNIYHGLFNVSAGYFDITGELNTNFISSKSGKVQAVKGGNMMFRKKVWEKVGRFDENYIKNSINEDNDFCFTAYKMDYQVYFNKEAVVRHLMASGGSRFTGTKKSSDWYQNLFRNHLYFFLKHFRKILLPFFFIYRMRQVYTCVFRYGKIRASYLLAPIKGYYQGIIAYKKWKSAL